MSSTKLIIFELTDHTLSIDFYNRKAVPWYCGKGGDRTRECLHDITSDYNSDALPLSHLSGWCYSIFSTLLIHLFLSDNSGFRLLSPLPTAIGASFFIVES